MSTRIVVTCANGFLGRRLVAALLADGHELRPPLLAEDLAIREEAGERLDTLASARLARESST